MTTNADAVVGMACVTQSTNTMPKHAREAFPCIVICTGVFMVYRSANTRRDTKIPVIFIQLSKVIFSPLDETPIILLTSCQKYFMIQLYAFLLYN